MSDKDTNTGDVACDETQETAQQSRNPRRRPARSRYRDAWGVLGYWIEDQEQ